MGVSRRCCQRQYYARWAIGAGHGRVKSAENESEAGEEDKEEAAAENDADSQLIITRHEEGMNE